LAAEGKCWRFVAKFENGKAEIGLQVIGKEHPFYDLQAQTFSHVYNRTLPGISDDHQGYGAGAAVTAAGVFADIIRVSNI
jgi:aspartokinase/homoserine dehydrogenase 1